MKAQKIELTIIMPVYNAQAYLSESIASILDQSFKNFEFLIIDDCSHDQSVNVIESFSDKRIRLIKNQQNLGVAKTLNLAIQMARGEYIARMDADDIAMVKRLEKQIHFLRQNQDVDIIGTFLHTFGDVEQRWSHPLTNDDIKVGLMFHSCLFHPTVMFRNIFHNPYNFSFKYTEDYNFWTECALEGKILQNLDIIGLKYRLHANQIGQVRRVKQNEEKVLIASSYAKRALPSLKNINLAHTIQLIESRKGSDLLHFFSVYKNLKALWKANKEDSFFNNYSLKKGLKTQWKKFCLNKGKIGKLLWLGSLNAYSGLGFLRRFFRR